jgi:hypothetical protein
MKTLTKNARHLSARKGAWVAFAILEAVVLVGCHGKVQHPEKGEPNSTAYCADRNDPENNCMACSSQPGCGWCENPQGGEAHCQPGTSSSPMTCQHGWALSTEDCATPPPPPPPPAKASTETTAFD